MDRFNFKYVRIQGKELAKNTMYAKGVFSMCWQLIQQDVMIEEDADLFREIDSWFAENLPYNHPYFLVYTNTPGEIVYEDQYQIAAKVDGFLQIEELQESWSPED